MNSRKKLDLSPLQLIDIVYPSIQSKLLIEDVTDIDENISVDLKVATKSNLFIKPDHSNVYLKIVVEGKYIDGEQEIPVAIIEIELMGLLNHEQISDFTEKDIENTGLVLMYPFARETIFSLAAKLGIPGLYIPAISPIKVIADRENSND
ncbi:hypothetical protein [Lederbergia ruris]|uniref:hypothetical protein n=1 Tax=Lederbergia ruris TaxID=217495 RepID=UPI00399F7BD9